MTSYDLTKDRDFAEGAYQVVDSAWADGQDRQDIINNLLDNGFDNASAATLVDTVKQIRDTDTQLREERGFAQGGFDYVDGRLAEEATREEIFAELLDNGYTADTANLLLDNVINIFEQKAELVADASFAQGAYALVNSQLDNGKTKEEIVQLLADNNFPTDLAQGLVDSVQSYRDTITGLEGDVETEQGMTQFAQQAYDYINGQLDAETSLEDIVADLVDNGYTEAGANALVTNISDMRTNLAGVEAQLGTAQANQLFGQTAYSFVNEQLDIIANQDPDAETLLSESDIIQNLIDNGFSEANATTLVSNITTIRDTESGLREQISGLEAENTFVQGAYDLVTSRLETMSAQDPDAEVQITPESIVDELVAGGFDQTVAENLVNSVVGVRDQVNSLNMQLDSLGTQASFAQRAYTYVNTLLDQGKTSEEITNLLVDNGFVADTAATLVTEVTNTRDTISGLEGSLETTQGQRTFAQRSFDFVNTQLDGDVDQADIITDLMDNGFSETDANNLVNDAVTIRDNTSLLEANNAFSQGSYGFIQEQLDAGTSTVDIIQEMIDNGFDYTTAQGFVTNVVNVRNEVDTLSDALGIMESRAEFAQTAFDYINGQLDNKVQEDALLQDLVENYGFTANNAQSLVDSVQDTRFQQAERTRLETQLRSGVTFNFASAMQGQDDEDEPLVVDTDGDGVPDAPAVTTPSGPFTPVTERPDPYTFGTDDDTLPITEEEELDPGLGLLEFGPFGRPLGTYITQPTQPVGPFDAYAMQMPEEPIFDPQQARLGAQPTEVTLDEAGFVTEPVAYIPEEVPTDPTMYYSPQFNQFAQVPVGYGATTVPQSFIQQQLPAINEVTPQGIGAFLGRKPPEGVA